MAGGPERPPALDAVADVLGGEWHESGGRRYVIVDRTYAPGHRLGRVAVADCAPGDDGWPGQAWLGLASGARRPLFLDLETTGLAGGAGTCAFLVGCGWFEGAVFRVRQFVLASFAGERALLEAVADLAGRTEALVTYNGKTFDLPLIDTRFSFHRLEQPFAAMSHLDMLHVARRLWRAERASAAAEPQAACGLTTMEQTQLGHVRDDDVPGFEIPSRYFHYVRTGDARPLEAVLEHNRLDLLALAMITARAARLLHEGADGARTAREAIGLGRFYARAGRPAAARACFARAVELGGGAALRVEALRALALLCRRERRFAEAAAAWLQVLEVTPCPPHLAREATDALAVHHEHRVRDLRAARAFAVRSLEFDAGATRSGAVHHRLARLDRKLGVPPVPLF